MDTECTALGQTILQASMCEHESNHSSSFMIGFLDMYSPVWTIETKKNHAKQGRAGVHGPEVSLESRECLCFFWEVTIDVGTQIFAVECPAFLSTKVSLAIGLWRGV